jgi:hypothetical protein
MQTIEKHDLHKKEDLTALEGRVSQRNPNRASKSDASSSTTLCHHRSCKLKRRGKQTIYKKKRKAENTSAPALPSPYPRLRTQADAV